MVQYDTSRNWPVSHVPPSFFGGFAFFPFRECSRANCTAARPCQCVIGRVASPGGLFLLLLLVHKSENILDQIFLPPCLLLNNNNVWILLGRCTSGKPVEVFGCCSQFFYAPPTVHMYSLFLCKLSSCITTPFSKMT